MTYKQKEDKREYERNYNALHSEGYSLRDTYEPKKCLNCGQIVKPQSKTQKFCSSQCRQKHWQRSQNK